MSILLNTLSDALPTLIIVGVTALLLKIIYNITKDTVLFPSETYPPKPRGYSWDLVRPTRTMNLE